MNGKEFWVKVCKDYTTGTQSEELYGYPFTYNRKDTDLFVTSVSLKLGVTSVTTCFFALYSLADESNLQIQFDIDLTVLSTIKFSKFMPCSTTALKASVIIQIILYIITIIEVIANNITIFLDNEITAISIM